MFIPPRRSGVSRCCHLPTALLCSAMLFSSTAPIAAERSASMFSFSSFGTFGLIHSNEDEADFTTSVLQPTGAGYSRAWSADVDSRLGAQLIASFTPTVSAMLQVIAEQRYDNTDTPHLEWANIKYELTPEASVRVGRTVLATFLISDSRKVGYANPWIRPPVEVYSLVPITNNDGIDATYRLRLGNVIQTISGSYGVTTVGFPGGGKAEARRLWLIADTIEYGFATVHLSYMEANATLTSITALFDTFRQFGPSGRALADRYDLNHKRAQFVALGGLYDPGEWFVTGEWGYRNLRSALGRSSAWYTSGGYRWREFTPYLTYSSIEADSNTTDPGLNVSALPPALAAPATGLNAALNSLLGSIAVQQTISVGTRWDFAKNVCFKLQYDRLYLGAGSPGTLTNLQPGFRLGGRVDLVSAAVDFVW